MKMLAIREDARHSKSRSSPLSLLVLPATVAGGLSAADDSTHVKALGLADELDDQAQVT